MLLLTVNVMYGASRCCLILRSEGSLPLPYPWLWGIPIWKGQILVPLSRVLSRIYSFGGEVPSGRKARSFLGGSGNFLKWVCAEMQSSAFWDTIWRNVALTSSRLDDFPDIVTFVMITIFFWGGRGWGSFYPLNTLHRTLQVGVLSKECQYSQIWTSIKQSSLKVPKSFPSVTAKMTSIK